MGFEPERIGYTQEAMGHWLNDFVCFSLGRFCAGAFHLRRLGLRYAAGPLDWMGSDEPQGLLDVLATRFEDFMALENLLVIDQHHGHWVVVDERFRIRAAHVFPIDPRLLPGSPGFSEQPRSGVGMLSYWRLRFRNPPSRLRVRATESCSQGGVIELECYPWAIRRIRRRVAAFLRALDDPQPVLLIRQEDGMDEILRLLKLLRKLRKGRPFRLLAVGPDPTFRETSDIEELLTFPMEAIDSMKGPDSWQGDHEAWDRALDAG